MSSNAFYSAVEAIIAGNATVNQIQVWLEHPLRASGGDVMDALAVQLLTIVKRAEDIELKAISLADSIERTEIALPTTTAVAASSLAQALKDSKLRAKK